MQSFALAVIDFDGTKITELASELSSRGFAVSTPVSVTQSDEPAQEPGQEPAPVVQLASAVDVVEEKAFKCPACGATYDEQVTCTNAHPAEQTLPTADVNAGASPSADTTAAADGADAGGAGGSSSTTEAGDAETSTSSDTTEVTPTPPAPPSWPA